MLPVINNNGRESLGGNGDSSVKNRVSAVYDSPIVSIA